MLGLRSIALVVVVALSLAACSGDQPSEAEAGGDDPATAGADQTESERSEPPSDLAEALSQDTTDDEYPTFEGDRDEYYQEVVRCLRDAGWTAQTNEAGTELTVDDVSGEQRLRLVEDREQCRWEIGVPPPLPELTTDEIESLYDQALRVRECLEAEGHPGDPPPSRDVFVEQYPTGPEWWPYRAVGEVSEEEWERLNEVCPQPSLE